LSSGSDELTQFGNVEGVPAGSHGQEDQIHAGRRKKTPQSHLCWVLGCLLQQQNAIRARHDPGESNLQQVCEFRSHPQWIVQKSVGARQPWREEKGLWQRIGVVQYYTD
jgi:hypothetical protein